MQSRAASLKKVFSVLRVKRAFAARTAGRTEVWCQPWEGGTVSMDRSSGRGFRKPQSTDRQSLWICKSRVSLTCLFPTRTERTLWTRLHTWHLLSPYMWTSSHTSAEAAPSDTPSSVAGAKRESEQLCLVCGHRLQLKEVQQDLMATGDVNRISKLWKYEYMELALWHSR